MTNPAVSVSKFVTQLFAVAGGDAAKAGTASQSMDGESRIHRLIWNRNHLVILAVVLVLYLLGFNFYVPPTNGDDVAYSQGAVSLASGNGYTFQGEWIQDWPPVQSAFAAVAMVLTGVREFFVAKLVNLLSVAAALLLAHGLMRREQRMLPVVACLLVAVSPTSLIVGTGPQADFTFFTLSVIYFLLLGRLEKTRYWSDSVLCGIVLGTAALARWQGVVLGVGLIFQAFKVWPTPERWSAMREALASLIGAAMVIAWKYWLVLCQQTGLAASGNYEVRGGELWGQPAPLELGAELLNMFCQYENILVRIYPSGEWLVAFGAVLFWIAVFYGLRLRVKQHGWRATDCYVMATIAMYTIYAYKEARYALPIAPFLLDYVFRSFSAAFKSLMVRRVALAAVFSVLIVVDGVLLFYGDGNSTGPRSQLLLTDERSYLRGHYLDVYDVSRRIAEEYPGTVIACDKFHNFIIRHYSGLETHFPPAAPSGVQFDLFLEVVGFEFEDGLPEILRSETVVPRALKGRLSNPRKFGQVVLWDVD